MSTVVLDSPQAILLSRHTYEYFRFICDSPFYVDIIVVLSILI
jgi:hypothetical protein